MGEAPVDQRSPAEIRRDIDATRAELSGTIEQIEDRVSPSRIANRSGQRMRSRWTRTREAVMGSAQQGRQRMSHSSGSTGQRISGATDAAGERLEEAEEALERNVRGNPLAAGLIAFGAGALAASLLPSSHAEQEFAHNLREQAEPMVRKGVQGVGQDMGQELAKDVKAAAKETAVSAMHATTETASAAKDAAKDTGEQAKDAAQQTKQAGS